MGAVHVKILLYTASGDWRAEYKSTEIQGTTDWTRVTVTVDPAMIAQHSDATQIQVAVGSQASQGKAY